MSCADWPRWYSTHDHEESAPEAAAGQAELRRHEEGATREAAYFLGLPLRPMSNSSRLGVLAGLSFMWPLSLPSMRARALDRNGARPRLSRALPRSREG
jgi:hypothetical protein